MLFDEKVKTLISVTWISPEERRDPLVNFNKWVDTLPYNVEIKSMIKKYGMHWFEYNLSLWEK